VFEVTELLEKGFIYQIKPSKKFRLDPSQVESLLQIGVHCLEASERLFPNVYELTQQAALSYASAKIELSKKGKKSSDDRAEVESTVTSITEGMEMFGLEETAMIEVDEEMPRTLASALDLQLCELIYRAQLIMQELNKLKETSPKVRSNAAFLGRLRDQFEKLVDVARHKLVVEADAAIAKDRKSLVSFTPRQIAAQLILIDNKIFQAVDLDAIKNYKQSEDRLADDDPIQIYHDWCRYVSSWVQYEILGQTEEEKRIQAMSQWLSVSALLSASRDYNMLKLVGAVLGSSPVKKADGLVSGLKENQKFQLKKLEERTSIAKHHANLRYEMEDKHQREKPCIPYLEVYLEDLSRLNIQKATDSIHRRSCEVEIIRILDILRDFQTAARNFDEIHEPDNVIQHWILTRPYKNPLELDNLALTRCVGGGRYSPSEEAAALPPPTVMDFADEGSIRFNAVQERIISGYKDQL
jgi:hypothetical protein